MYEPLKLDENFIIEKELMHTRYPFSKNRTRILLDELKQRVKDLDSRADRFEILRQNLDDLVDKCFSKSSSQIITMRYCKSEKEREKYRVYLRDGKLCYYRDDKYLPIDSTAIFMDFFDGRTPEEDEKYLETIGFPLLPERAGKSNFSCFVINKDMNLYINPYRPDTMQHTFTTSGEDVLCAGLLLLKNGIVCYIDNTSGHYKTSNEKLELFFLFLKENSKDYDIKWYFDEKFLSGREKFSWPLGEIFKKNEFGLKFRHLFRDKTLVEVENERQLRTKIFMEYGLGIQHSLKKF